MWRLWALLIELLTLLESLRLIFRSKSVKDYQIERLDNALQVGRIQGVVKTVPIS